ncbi:hypothetical protein [Yokenella regensburgei]|uniref:hypothetical protein n=1 Tax=Yokenella regensburgei TaxID=158877 RepID=UPI0031E1DB42
MNQFILRSQYLSLALLGIGHTHAAVTVATDTVKGRPAEVSNVTITNQSAPGLNPAQGDTLAVTYDYSDPDAIPEDTASSSYSWMADDVAVGAPVTGSKTYVPGADALNKILKVQITAAESSPSDPDKAPMVESAPTSAPVLPPRSEFESLYHLTNSVQRWGDAYMYCANRGERLMSIAELQEMFVTYTRATAVGESNSDLRDTYGYGLSNPAWSSNPDGSSGDTRHSYVYVQTDGHNSSNTNASAVPVGCAKFGTPEGLPTVTNVNVPDPVIGTALTATYTYNGNATIPDLSRFQWYRADDANGTGKAAITGATAKTYTPTAEDAGKWLIIDITPASYDTVVGNVVSADSSVAVAQPITITDALIEKPTDDRKSFQVNYTVQGGTESGTTYQWYWKGEAVSGATSKTFAFSSLTIPSASTPEELSVEVTPRDSNGLQGAVQRVTIDLQSSIAWNAPLGQSTWYDMAKTCASQSNGNRRPGTTEELKALLASLGSLTAYGVNTNNSYWTGTKGSSQGSHQRVHMSSGNTTETSDTGAGERGLCVAGSAPAAPAFGSVLVNGHTFADTGFPTTGFTDAYFEFKGLKDSNANDWTYRSTDTSKAIVFNDNNWWAGVQLKAKGSATIEVYNIAGGNPVSFTINPSKWFVSKEAARNYPDAAKMCGDATYVSGNSEYIPHLNTLTTASAQNGNYATRSIGTLWGEWGDMSLYGWTFPSGDAYYWAQEREYGSADDADITSLQTGRSGVSNTGNQLNVVCKG